MGTVRRSANKYIVEIAVVYSVVVFKESSNENCRLASNKEQICVQADSVIKYAMRIKQSCRG